MCCLPSLSLQEFEQLFAEKSMYMRRTAAAEVRKLLSRCLGGLNVGAWNIQRCLLSVGQRYRRVQMLACHRTDLHANLPQLACTPASAACASVQAGLSQYETQVEGLKAQLEATQEVGCRACGHVKE